MPREVAERGDAIAAVAEVFREHGYAGSSLATITQQTGLGKGSLYHFFPNGKQEMAEAVLEDVSHWFEENVFAALRDAGAPARGIERMFEAVEAYFHSGERICLLGAFALGDGQEAFEGVIHRYFSTWTEALSGALLRTGFTPTKAEETAEEVVVGIKGALVLARSRQDPQVFTRTLARLKRRIPTIQ